ncbi:MAG: phosphoribosylamine--glycine ligase [Bacillota bacterium]
MKVMVVGSGGREHALAWKIRQSSLVREVFALPGNPGMEAVARRLPGDPRDVATLVRAAEDNGIGLTVIGPEDPLAVGVVDTFTGRGLTVFGPTAAATVLESSKVFAKGLMREHGLPTADFRVFDSPEEARAYVAGLPEGPVVVKADGLSAGKGVAVAAGKAEALAAIEEIMVLKTFGPAGRRVVIEEFLTGEEVSVLALTDGEEVLTLGAAQDHKQIHDGDRGPNTGGMGAFSPVPAYTPEVGTVVEERILKPAVRAMAASGRPFRGTLFAGLMLTAGGPKVLEFNARFGDPETQVLLPRLRCDLVPLLLAAARGSLAGLRAEVSRDAAACVVMASSGYPGPYEKGLPITGLEEAAAAGATVFHAGTARDASGRLVTAGGRVLGVTAVGSDLAAAAARAYAAVERISFRGAHYRRDIGGRRRGAARKEG